MFIVGLSKFLILRVLYVTFGGDIQITGTISSMVFFFSMIFAVVGFEYAIRQVHVKLTASTV